MLSSHQQNDDLACRHNQKDLVLLLIEKGADVNGRGFYDATPLDNVSDVEIAKILVEHGADINAINQEGLSPLANAAYHLPVLRYLLSLGARTDPANKKGRTAIGNAAMAGDWLAMKALLEAGAAVGGSERGMALARDTAQSFELLGDEEQRIKLLLRHVGDSDYQVGRDGISPQASGLIRYLRATQPERLDCFVGPLAKSIIDADCAVEHHQSGPIWLVMNSIVALLLLGSQAERALPSVMSSLRERGPVIWEESAGELRRFHLADEAVFDLLRGCIESTTDEYVGNTCGQMLKRLES